MDKDTFLTSETIQMLVSSLTNQGHAQLTEIEVERFLNALTRAQSNVPTGVPQSRTKSEQEPTK